MYSRFHLLVAADVQRVGSMRFIVIFHQCALLFYTKACGFHAILHLDTWKSIHAIQSKQYAMMHASGALLNKQIFISYKVNSLRAKTKCALVILVMCHMVVDCGPSSSSPPFACD